MKDYLKVGISGVRGIAGETLTPQIACAFACAFGSYGGRGPVVVGRDTRASGPMFERAVVAGLQSTGCKPLLAGIVPTPTLLYLTKKLQARGGIAITASHNPAPWNALKFVDDSGLFLPPARALEFFDIYHQRDFSIVPEADIPRPATLPDPMAGHRADILAYVDTVAIRAARFRVAVDCCNGVGALYSRPFLESLGCTVFSCYDRVTGEFEREAEPLPENLGTLSGLVRENECAIGFAQDPDGDRLALTDERGNPLGEDLTVALAIRQVLDVHSRGPVAVNLSTSRVARAVAEQRGVPALLTPIGEINVTGAMLAAGAVVGGEGNGGVIIPAIHPCRDSFAGMAVVLELMAHTRRTVSELRSELPRYHLVKEKMTIRSDEGVRSLRAVRRHFRNERLNLQDGVHVDFPDRWVHVRMSNTEPVLRLVAEAPDENGARELIRQVRLAIGAL